MNGFEKYDDEFIISVDCGFWPLVIYPKDCKLTFPKTLSVSEAFERSKKTGEAFGCEGSLKCAKLLKELNDSLGREIDKFGNIAILNYGRKDPIEYNGDIKKVKKATKIANIVLGLIPNDLKDDEDIIGISSDWIEHALQEVVDAQNR